LITKAETYVTYYGKPLQHALWSFLKEMPQFSLIGKKMTVEDLNWLEESTNAFWGFGDKYVPTNSDYELVWVSGDYKGATDSLSIHVTKAWLKVLKAQFFLAGYRELTFELDTLLISPDDDVPINWSIFERSLFEQEIEYPSKPLITLLKELGYEKFLELFRFLPGQTDEGEDNFIDLFFTISDKIYPKTLEGLISFLKDSDHSELSVDQHTGQLMGSILSFPILCLSNFTTYWMMVESVWPAWSNDRPLPNVNSAPVLINGDDILFKIPKIFYDTWLNSVGKLGFKLSLGKNYVHPYILTVNSLLYVQHPDGGFSEVPYMNLGALFGYKSPVEADQILSDDLSVRLGLVLVGSQDPNSACSRFISYNHQQIQDQTRKGFYNLFLPKSHGGIGLQAPMGFNFDLTTRQFKLACWCQDLLRNFESGYVCWSTLKKYLSRRPHYVDQDVGISVNDRVRDKMIEDVLEHPKRKAVPLQVVVIPDDRSGEISQKLGEAKYFTPAGLLSFVKRMNPPGPGRLSERWHKVDPRIKVKIPNVVGMRSFLDRRKIALRNATFTSSDLMIRAPSIEAKTVDQYEQSWEDEKNWDLVIKRLYGSGIIPPKRTVSDEEI